MIYLAGDTFQMGEKPAHSVNVKAFAVGKFEVTVAEYLACVQAGRCPQPEWREAGSKYNIETGSDAYYKKLGGALTGGSYPIVGVSWNDAKTYVAWLNSKVGGSPYRLLTEAEWEYAARAGTTDAYPWGPAIGVGNANCDGCGSQWDNKQTAPVGSFAKNAFGLHDMHGNVWEWVEDCWHVSYSGAPSDGSAWTTGCSDTSRVLRGGSWYSVPANLRSANRLLNTPTLRDGNYGFRVARTVF